MLTPTAGTFTITGSLQKDVLDFHYFIKIKCTKKSKCSRKTPITKMALNTHF